jgi:hypothetical protein
MEADRDRSVDAWIAASRCLEAMATTADVETRRALWRAACKYMRRDGVAGRPLEKQPSGPRAVRGLADAQRKA